jgi:hypothetical protein
MGGHDEGAEVDHPKADPRRRIRINMGLFEFEFTSGHAIRKRGPLGRGEG